MVPKAVQIYLASPGVRDRDRQEPRRWASLGGDAQKGALSVMFDGMRVNPTYDPMRKQGAILLGNGGDNSDGSQGTFYEGAMTAAGTFPSNVTDQLVQANIAAAGYGVTPLTVSQVATASAGREGGRRGCRRSLRSLRGTSQ